MNFQADAMAETMAKLFRIASVPDQVSSRGIDVPACRTRTDLFESGHLRVFHNLVNLPMALRCRPYAGRPCQVAMVKPILDSHIDQKVIARSNFGFARNRMWNSRVLSSRGDRLKCLFNAID